MATIYRVSSQRYKNRTINTACRIILLHGHSYNLGYRALGMDTDILMYVVLA